MEMQQRKVIITRHGDTENGRGGGIRSPEESFLDQLSNLGIAQSQALATYLSENIHPTVVFTSPLIRAVQTGEIVAKYNRAPLHIASELSEMDLGDISHLSSQERQLAWGECLRRWVENHDYSLPHGESMNEVAQRVVGFLQKISCDLANEVPVIVGHQGALAFGLAKMIEGNPIHWEKYILSNCSLTILYVDSLWLLEKLNDVTHLGTLPSYTWSPNQTNI